MFFAFFALPRGHAEARVLVASFTAYAVLSVAFFQFGVGIAADRVRPWETFVRTLPVGPEPRLAGRMLSALLFAAGSVAVVLAVALPTVQPGLDARAWARLALALAAGSIPFTLLGVGLGYWVPPKAALPAANVLYLSLAYLGGLWTGPTGLPDTIDRIGRPLPTRQWGDVLWPAATGRAWTLAPWLALLAYAVGFGALATWGYRRDEGRRYR